jgi:hypothetical protein
MFGLVFLPEPLECEHRTVLPDPLECEHRTVLPEGTGMFPRAFSPERAGMPSLAWVLTGMSSHPFSERAHVNVLFPCSGICQEPLLRHPVQIVPHLCSKR